MFLQHQLGQKRTNALHVEQLDDVDLIGELFTSLLMPFQLFKAALQPIFPAEARATTEKAEQGCQQILRVVVEVFASLSDNFHERVARLRLALKLTRQLSIIVAAIWRGWIDCADQRVLQFESFVTTKQDGEDGPEQAREATDQA